MRTTTAESVSLPTDFVGSGRTGMSELRCFERSGLVALDAENRGA